MVIIILAIVIVVLGLAVVLLVRKAEDLQGKLNQAEGDATFYLNKSDSLVLEKTNLIEVAATRRSRIFALEQQLEESQMDRALALWERDTAMDHLENTLVSAAADRVVPDRISVEVSRDGVHYVFSYDPPEFAEVTPITPLTGSTPS